MCHPNIERATALSIKGKMSVMLEKSTDLCFMDFLEY